MLECPVIYLKINGRDHMVIGFKLPMQSVPMTTNVVSSNHAHC